MTSLGRLAAVGLATCAGALLVASASAEPVRVQVGLPKPGATTLVVAQLNYRGKLPREVKVRIRDRLRLPASTRGLYAIYGKQRGRRAVLTAYTILLRQQSPATASALASADTAAGGKLVGPFEFLALALVGEKIVYGESRGGGLQLRTMSQPLTEKAPTEPPPKLEDILKAGGVPRPSAENPGNLGPNLLDTGHYDDGHAFGWKSSGTNAAIGDWMRLTARGDPYGDVIDKIEADLNADLDGDGAIGKAGSGPGTSIGTEVGPPTIIRLP